MKPSGPEGGEPGSRGYRVLYLLRYFPTLSETFVNGELGSLAARGVHVVVASLGTRPDGRLADHLPGISVLRVPRHPFTGRLSPPTAGMRWLAAQQRPKDVARLPWIASRARHFHRLHVHFAGEAAEMARAIHMDLGIPYSVTVHAADLFRPRPSFLEVLRDADAVITISSFNVSRLSQLGTEAKLVHCGPDLTKWALLPLPPDPLRVLSVGRDVPKKGMDILLKAWAWLQSRDLLPGSASLSIAGGFPSVSGLPGLDVLGPLPSAQLKRVMAACNLFVLPCRKAADGDMDGIPVAVMEAMASGRPVISTTISGIPELVDESVGWLVAPDNPEALAAAMLEATAGERAARGAMARRRLRERGFTLSQQVQGLMDAWNVESKPGRWRPERS